MSEFNWLYSRRSCHSHSHIAYTIVRIQGEYNIVRRVMILRQVSLIVLLHSCIDDIHVHHSIIYTHKYNAAPSFHCKEYAPEL